MIPERLKHKLKDSNCKHIKGIPLNTKNNPEDEDWNRWDDKKISMAGKSYYDRSIGKLPEKECSKSFARFLKNYYTQGDEILDFGCATGHYLRSLRSILDNNILYTGIDSHLEFLLWGAKAYGINEDVNFIECDVLDIPVNNKSFDISMVQLFHFFPNIEKALKEAIRVTNKYIIWRTPIGIKGNYMIKITEDKSYDELGLLTYDRDNLQYDLYMLYSKKYINKLVQHLGAKVIEIKRDLDFKPFDNTMLPEFEYQPSTKTVGEYQINGCMVLDWHYFVIDCRGE